MVAWTRFGTMISALIRRWLRRPAPVALTSSGWFLSRPRRRTWRTAAANDAARAAETEKE